MMKTYTAPLLARSFHHYCYYSTSEAERNCRIFLLMPTYKDDPFLKEDRVCFVCPLIEDAVLTSALNLKYEHKERLGYYRDG